MSDKDDSHALEIHNLCLLNQLKHAHILELLTFYTYNKHRNFVFPLATGGDLDCLFDNEGRPAAFQTNFDFYQVLGNVSSAIEKVHNYTASNNVDLKLIGLHRHLKPNNILVDQNNFILADFGLSRFKPSKQKSKTPFRIGGGDYLAPECEDLEQGFRKGLIGRASDIWSFRCILTEVLIYMFEGSKALQEFRRNRRFSAIGYTLSTFHCPGGHVNAQVLEILSKLQRTCDTTGSHCVELIRTTLSIAENERPEAPEVTKRLYGIAINQLLCDITKSYAKVAEILNTFPALIELERLKSWEYVLGFSSNEKEKARSVLFGLDFEQCVSLLKGIQEELKSMTGRFGTGTYPLFLEIQGFNDKLIELLPLDLRQRAFSFLEVALLDDKNPLINGEIMQHQDAFPMGSRFRLLSFIKRLTGLAGRQLDPKSQGEGHQVRQDLRLKGENIQGLEPFEDHHLANISENAENDTKKVLVEWIKYGMHWEGPVLEEMVGRVGTIAAYFSKVTADASALHILHCRGYFFSIGGQSFSLVYNFPPGTTDTAPTTLNALISQTRTTNNLPALNECLSLATKLAATLLDLRKATLLHKSISSSNIVLFSGKKSHLRHFYLIGFNHARPNDPKAFTEGPPPSPNARRYHHPDYTIASMRRGNRFRLEYDYYSLGLMLLEIGLWDTIASVKATSGPEMKAKILKN